MATFYDLIATKRKDAEINAKIIFGKGGVQNQLDIDTALNNNRKAVENSEKEVTRLSRLPARLTSSSADKVTAMQKVM